MKHLLFILSIILLLTNCRGGMGGAPTGAQESLSAAQQAAREAIGKKVNALIVWSSSRIGNHDLFLMTSDGSNIRALTKGKHVDWYPRFSKDGKKILFTRSKKGWVSERDANAPRRWDLYLINTDGSGLKKIVDNGSWGDWTHDGNILFARGQKLLIKNMKTNEEKEIVDSEKVATLDGAELQNPHLSKDGNYIAITLRGAKRATGIYSIKDQSWHKTGEGCQIAFFPTEESILWVNPTGNGGSEVFKRTIENGKAVKDHSYDELRYIDIPGRRSHEYFPKLSNDGKWLVWAATKRGHDHDIADYEIYLWQVGSPANLATRLTYNSGNDRWPDIFIQ